MVEIQFIHTWTDDGLKLPGVYYPSENKDLCVLFIHGMAGNITSNQYVDHMGQFLANKAIGCIYAHNRGHSYINSLVTNQKNEKGSGHKTKTYGLLHERFTDCQLDINAWINTIIEKGYKRIILMGHSLGANKVLYHLHRNQTEEIQGVILASPPDLNGLVLKPGYEPHYQELLEEANVLMSQNKPGKVLSRKLWDEHLISAQTFLDLFISGCPADNLPLLKNPEVYPELASINAPMLCLMGEYDDIAIRTLEEDMELIKVKATGSSSFTGKFIKNAHHDYMGEAEQVTQIVYRWLDKNYKSI